MERFDSAVFFKEDNSIRVEQIAEDGIRITINMGDKTEAWIDLDMQGESIELIDVIRGLSGNI